MRLQTIPNFDKAYKKLKSNQKADVDAAIQVILADPDIGERKKGDLAGLRVYIAN